MCVYNKYIYIKPESRSKTVQRSSKRANMREKNTTQNKKYMCIYVYEMYIYIYLQMKLVIMYNDYMPIKLYF